jgi:hypothetical protein
VKEGEREINGENGDIGGEEGVRAARETLGKEESKEGHGFGKEGEEEDICPSKQKSFVWAC